METGISNWENLAGQRNQIWFGFSYQHSLDLMNYYRFAREVPKLKRISLEPSYVFDTLSMSKIESSFDILHKLDKEFKLFWIKNE